MSTTTQLGSAAIQQELAAFAKIIPLLPEAVVQEVTTRIEHLQQPTAVVSPAAAIHPAVLPVLVTRPGVPPRPLDPFYFEVTPPPAKL